MKMEPAPDVPVYGIVVEKDVDVPMRDGARLKADVFRPDDGGTFPAILNLGPYQKDKLWVPPGNLEEKPNPLMNWETVNPQWWVPKGYGAVRVDGRGSGKSPGECEPWSLAESIDLYDAIEWAAGAALVLGQGRPVRHIVFCHQPVVRRQSSAAVAGGDHSLGRLRRSLPRRAVSRRTAQPIHAELVHGAFATPRRRSSLPAPSEPLADQYAVFLAAQQSRQRCLPRRTGAMGQDHGADVQRRQLVGHGIASAREHRGLHASGDAAQEAPHPRRHACASILLRGRAARSAALLRLLAQSIDNGVMSEPPVKLAIRKGRNEVEWRFEHEWPLARTQWTKFYFDLSQPAPSAPANVGRLVAANPQACSSRTYPASSLGSMGSTSAAASQVMGGAIPPGMGIALETPPLAQDVEVTGPVAAVLWVASSTEDMDLFLTIRNIDRDGNEVLETGQQGTPVPVAKGWLRVSHRELDAGLSLPYRPYHRHQRRLYLTPGEIVRVEVEIWPTSMVFKKGHRIRLDVQPRDGIGSTAYMHY